MRKKSQVNGEDKLVKEGWGLPRKKDRKKGRSLSESRINLFLIFCLFFTFISAGFSPSCSSSPTKAEREEATSSDVSREISLRNVVNEEVHYFIREIYADSAWVEKTLPVGAVEKFKSRTGCEIRFLSASGEKEYRLDPGQAYSFRYDEKGELELFEGSHGRTDAVDLAPFVPTPMEVVERMLELAELTKDDVLYDLGCGDGRIVVEAAKKYRARGVGIDLDPQRIKESKERARQEGVTELVSFRQQDVMKADFSSATVVTLYLLPESNELLRPLLEQQLKPGARVVSHNYEIPGWEEKQVAYETLTTGDGITHTIYVYRR